MLVIDNGDAIRGIAEVATQLDFIVNGYVGTTATQLADGQLGTSEANLYASGADGTVVTSITIVNTDSAARTFTLYLKPSAGTSRAITPVSLDLPAGYSFYTDGQRTMVMNTEGQVVATAVAAAHDLGGVSHTADTLADFNTKISDATLVDSASIVLNALFDANTILAATSDDTPAAITIAEQRLIGRITSGNIKALTAAEIATLVQGSIDHGSMAGLGDDDHTQYILKTLADAHTILYAVSDDTPAALTVGASRIVGRKSTGNIIALTAAELLTIIGVETAATADQTGLEIVTLLEALSAGNRLDHGAGLTGLGDDDHTQYMLDTVANANSMLYSVTDNTPAALAVAASRIVGRKATGNIVALTAAELLTIISVESGATADQTGAEIKTAYEVEVNAYTDTKNTKLATIATNADVTGSNAPQAHKASHQDTGGDEISATGLSGLLADDQHVLDSEVTAVAIAKALLTTRGDIIYRNATVPARLAKGSSGYVLTMGANDPAWAAPASGAVITSGSYSGNDSANRAIAHGLGVTPKIVMINISTSSWPGLWLWQLTIGSTQLVNATNSKLYSVTDWTSTNFYVGNATNYDFSANGNSLTYDWVAIG